MKVAARKYALLLLGFFIATGVLAQHHNDRFTRPKSGTLPVGSMDTADDRRAGPQNELDDLGGPDVFGYSWRDSDEPDGPAFTWEDLSAIGTLSPVSNTNDSAEQVALPFDFPYYGLTFTDAFLSSNGNIHFGPTELDNVNSPLPGVTGPGGVVAAFWDDLDPGAAGDVYYHGNTDRFIAQWTAVERYNSPGPVFTFQLILFADGRIKYQYQTLEGLLNSCTVGIEDNGEVDGLQVVFDADYLAETLAIEFYPPPTPFDLLSPDDGTVSNTISVDLTWEQSFDYDPFDQVTYQVHVSTDEGDLGPPLVTGLEGTDTTWTFNGEDDQTYWWSVHAVDNNSPDGAWADQTWSFDTYVFDPPDPFNLLTPPDGFMLPGTDVTLAWEATTDPDPGDNVTYEVYVSDNPNYLGLPLATGLTVTTYDFTGVDNTVYYWRIKAIDGNSPGRWSIQRWEFVTAIPEPPEAFNLADPGDGQVVPTTDVTLTWTTSNDPDFGDQVLYEVYVSTDPLDLGAPVATDLTDTSYTFNGDDDTQYWWRIKAVDQDLLWIWSDETWSFSIFAIDPPDPFNLLSPADGLESENTEVILTWEITIDPDPGDNVTYDVYVSTDPGDLGPPVATDLNTTSFIFTGIDNTVYYWRILAVDTNSPGTWSDQQWSFTVDIPEPPGSFGLTSPADGYVSQLVDLTLEWSASTDPDPGDMVTYEVYVSQNPDDLGPPVATGLTGTTHLFTGVHDAEYWWQVRAVDLDSLAVWSDELWSFSIYATEPPNPFNLIMPENGDTLFSRTNVFYWEHNGDPNPGEELFYSVHVSDNPAFINDHVYGPYSENELLPTITTQWMEDDSPHWWKVYALDAVTEDSVESDEIRWFLLYLPEPPLPFDKLYPFNDQTVQILGPTLVWENAPDPDPGDQITYTLEWALNWNYFQSTIVEGITDTFYVFQEEELHAAIEGYIPDGGELDELLPDDIDVFWRLRATDRFDSSLWAGPVETWAFSVAYPEPPNSFSLLLPPNQSVQPEPLITMTWEQPDDPDPETELTYDLYLREGDGVPQGIVLDLTDTTYVFEAWNDDQSWEWTILARDNQGQIRWANDTLSFYTYFPESPEEFSLLEPPNNSIIQNSVVQLSWEEANDPDPDDQVTYNVESSIPGSGSWIIARDLVEPSFDFTIPFDDEIYSWRVQALDSNSDGTWSSETWNFIADIREAPLPFDLASPEDGSVLDSLTPTLAWHGTTDPDASGQLNYTLVWSVNDPQFNQSDSISGIADTFYTFCEEQLFAGIMGGSRGEPRTSLTESKSPGRSCDSDKITPGSESAELTHKDATSSYVPERASGETGNPDDGSSYHGLDQFGDDISVSWFVRAVDGLSNSTMSNQNPVDNQAFSFSIYVEQPPEAFDLAFPANYSTVTSLEVELGWEEAVDPDPGDQVVYDLYVSNDPEDMGNPVATLLTDTSYTFTSQDDRWYYWRVVAHDMNDNTIMATSDFKFFVSVPEEPIPFQLAGPEDGALFVASYPTLCWYSTTDPDPADTLITYTVYWDDDSLLTSPDSIVGLRDTSYYWDGSGLLLGDGSGNGANFADNNQVALSIEPAGFASHDRRNGNWAVNPAGDDELDDGDNSLTVFWTVRAVDSNTSGRLAEQEKGWSFNIYVYNAPYTFNLISPEFGDQIDSSWCRFTWEKAHDDITQDSIEYLLELSLNPDFVNPICMPAGKNTNLVYSSLTDDQTYWWRVRARDTYYRQTFSNEIRIISTFFPESPEEFSLVEPSDNRLVPWEHHHELYFSWEASDDPDPGEDDISYIVRFDMNINDSTEIPLVVENLTDTRHWFNLPESLGIANWTTPIEVNWHVEAASNGDTITCRSPRLFLYGAPEPESNWFNRGVPQTFSIVTTYPSPFNTVMNYVVGIPQAGTVKIEIFDLLGRRVLSSKPPRLSPGYHRFAWNAKGQSAGMFFLRVTGEDGSTSIRHIIYVK